jgi:hypothetical protein
VKGRGLALGAWLVAAVGCKASSGPPENHRAADVACPLGAPLSTSPCDAAADCPTVAGVACIAYEDAGGPRYCNDDVCHVDSDCADGGVCACGAVNAAGALTTPNVCLGGGNCRTDADCSPVRYCSPSSIGCGTTFAYYCHTPSDECSNDADCRETQFCQYVPAAKKWSCVSGVSCNG